MLQNKMFFKQLQEFLKANPGLSWQSDSSGEEIEPVRLAWHRLYNRTKTGFVRWEQEADGEAESRLYGQTTDDVDNGVMWKLEDLFRGKQLISIKRPDDPEHPDNPRFFQLYILARFGWWYVGIKVKLVET